MRRRRGGALDRQPTIRDWRDFWIDSNGWDTCRLVRQRWISESGPRRIAYSRRSRGMKCTYCVTFSRLQSIAATASALVPMNSNYHAKMTRISFQEFFISEFLCDAISQLSVYLNNFNFHSSL